MKSHFVCDSARSRLIQSMIRVILVMGFSAFGHTQVHELLLKCKTRAARGSRQDTIFWPIQCAIDQLLPKTSVDGGTDALHEHQCMLYFHVLKFSFRACILRSQSGTTMVPYSVNYVSDYRVNVMA